MDDWKYLGEQLRRARVAGGKSVRELEQLDPALTRAVISRVERGERQPSAQTLLGYARALELQIVIDGSGIDVARPRARRRAQR